MSLDMESIHDQMLAAIDDRYQKTPGFPAYDFTRAFALACASLADDISDAEDHVNVAMLTGLALDTYVYQHSGLYRRDAVSATATLRIVSGSGSIRIEIGDLFSTESGIQFEATEDGTYTVGGTFEVQAVAGGTSGNVAAETITLMPITISGLGSVINDAAATGGVDEEDDDTLRNRFYNAIQNPANGGNANAYMRWAMSVEGVGRVYVQPTPNGPNTLWVWINNSTGGTASASLISSVQALIDPNGNGDGSGEAPIGALCTVKTMTAKNIAVSVHITPADGVSEEAAEAAVTAAITKVVKEAALAGGILRYGKISDACLIEDVTVDYSNLTINSGTASITIGNTETPVLTGVTFVAGS